MDPIEEAKVSKDAVAPKKVEEAPAKKAPAKVAQAAAASEPVADKFFVVKADRVLSIKGQSVHLRAGKKISQANYGGAAAIKSLIAAGVLLEEVAGE